FFFSSRRRHTRSTRDWSSDVCSSDLVPLHGARQQATRSAEAGARGGARRGGGGREALAETATDRRRQIVRRTDDIAGAGHGAAEIGRASCRERGESTLGCGGE